MATDTPSVADRRAQAELFITALLPPERASGLLFVAIGGTPRWVDGKYDNRDGRWHRRG
ncbi:MAG: hypothetical protein WCB92_06615 [Mycobacterium sp.]